jgi:hypothetical protein
VRPGTGRRRLDGKLLLAGETRVVFVDVELPVEAEILSVRAQESLDVRVAGQDVEVLLLERAEVLRTDLGVSLHPGQLEPLAQPRFAQAVAYLEHGARDCNVIVAAFSRGPG